MSSSASAVEPHTGEAHSSSHRRKEPGKRSYRDEYGGSQGGEDDEQQQFIIDEAPEQDSGFAAGSLEQDGKPFAAYEDDEESEGEMEWETGPSERLREN